MKNYMLYIAKIVFSYFLFIVSMNAIAVQVPQYQIQTVTEILPPYQIYNENGMLDGFSTEVINALFKQANAKANIKVMPWARAYSTALNVKNVMIFSITKSENRKDKFLWVGDIFKEKICFWTIDNTDKLTDSEFFNKRFAAARFSIDAQYLIDNNYKNIYLTSNENQTMEMLFSDRTDYILSTEYLLKLKTKALKLDFSRIKKVEGRKVASNPLSIAFNINSDIEMVEHFQHAFVEIKRNGKLSEITKKWSISSLGSSCD